MLVKPILLAPIYAGVDASGIKSVIAGGNDVVGWCGGRGGTRTPDLTDVNRAL